MSDDTSLAADLSAAMGDTSTQSAAEQPAATVESQAPEGAATTAPAGESTATATERKGPIPFDVHHTALENARKKAVEEAQATWQRENDAAIRHQQRWQADKVARIQELLEEASQDPAAKQQLLSMQARALAMARQRAADTEQTGPDLSRVVLDLGEGQSVAWGDLSKSIREQILAEVRQEFAPVAQTFNQLREAAMAAQREQEVTHFVTTTFEDVRTWPGMDSPENQKKVGEALATMQIKGDDPREVALALNAIYRSTILPSLSTTAHRSVVNQLQAQVDSATVNPAKHGAATPQTVDQMSTADYMRHVMAGGR